MTTRSRAVVYELVGGALLVIPDDVPAELVHRDPVPPGASAEREVSVRERSANALRDVVWRVQNQRDEELGRMGMLDAP